ncbi:MAG TPA: hypothetical protein PKL15_13310 [Saprospiraceae bacterium]|nr:hypothetical protein [Saprospiraceae bacterium]
MAKKTSGKKSLSRSRYFRVAGQILMVFVGVTMALLFDEWRHGQKAQQDEAYYLEQLELDLEQAIAAERHDSLGFFPMAAARQRIGDALRQGQSLPADTLVRLLPLCFREAEAPVNLPSFDLLQASGQLGIIQNKALLKALLHLHLNALPALRNSTEQYNRSNTGAEAAAAAGGLQDPALRRVLQNPVFEALAQQYRVLLLLQQDLLQQIQEDRALR